MGLTSLPPLKAVRVPSVMVPQQQQPKRKARTSRHHYLLRMRREESVRMRRLGSGLLDHEELDSAILTHLVSLLESQRGGPYTLGVGEGQETDVASPRVLEGGGFTRRPPFPLPIPAAKTHAACQTSRGTMTSESRGELAETAPVTSGREVSTVTSGRAVSTDSSSVSSVPQLPPIAPHHPLSPIKDVSRETSQLLNLPALRTERREEEGGAPSVHVMPATPQHSTLTELPSLRNLRHDTERSMSEASGYNLSSDSSVTADPSLIFAQRSSRRAKAKGSGRHYGAARRPSGGSSLESPSLRGSLVLAPDGEIIQVGGTIPPPPQQDVGVMRDLASQLRLYDGGLLTDDSGMSDEDEEWRRSGRGRQLKSVSPRKATAANKYSDQSGGCGVSEQDILDTLTEQAKLIADALLDKEESGADLERDVREAADMWMEAHPARDISRHQSLEEALKSEALEELVAAYRESSADPTAAQYRQLIRQSLILAVAKGAGLSPDQIPEDLEISPELLEALVSQSLSPEALTIGYDQDTGRPVIRARQLTGRPGADSPQPFSTLQQDLGEAADGGLGMTRSADSAIHSVSAQPDSLLSDVSPGLDYGQKAVEMAGIPPALLRDSKRADKPVLLSGDVGSAGTVDHKAKIPKTVRIAPASEGKSKKGKKDRKKKGQKKKRGKREEESGQETEGDTPGSPPPGLSPTREPVESTSDEPLSPKSPSGSSLSERALQSSPEPVKSDDETEFPVAKDEVQVTSSSPEKAGEPIPFPDDEDEDEDDDDSEEKSQANREARAARRAAAAARRKEEVERRRKEREEQVKMTKGELERQEQLKREMEMERLKREEERRLRRLRDEEEAEREAREQEEERRRLQLEEERERREKEEHQRRLEEMRREQMEEEARRNALLLEKEREEERRRAEEEYMLSQMAEQERAEYERMKREEEEARKRKEEEDRQERALEAERAMEEARRLAEEMARKQAALEAKLHFNRSLRREARSLGHSQDINRAFVFSYFQLLQWLGLDIPQLELAKMRRY